jgi:hypothetical protein
MLPFKTRFSLYAPHAVDLGLIVGGQKKLKILKKVKIKKGFWLVSHLR